MPAASGSKAARTGDIAARAERGQPKLAEASRCQRQRLQTESSAAIPPATRHVIGHVVAARAERGQPKPAEASRCQRQRLQIGASIQAAMR